MYLPKQMQITTQEKGEILKNNEKVVALGIQGPPETIFQINGGSDIKIGKTGIYELDLTNGLGLITSINFTEVPGNILVDILYITNELGDSV